MLDFHVTGGGTVYLLHPKTEAAKAWVAENIPDDAHGLGNSIAVEHRYIGDIVAGIAADGLEVARVH